MSVSARVMVVLQNNYAMAVLHRYGCLGVKNNQGCSCYNLPTKNNRGMVAHAAIIWCDVPFLATSHIAVAPQHGSRQVCIPGSASFSAPSSVAGRFTVPVSLAVAGPSAAPSVVRRLIHLRTCCRVPLFLHRAISGSVAGLRFYASGLRLQHPAASRPPSFNRQLSLPVAQRSCLPNPVCKTLRFCLRRVFCRSYQRLSPLVFAGCPAPPFLSFDRS